MPKKYKHDSLQPNRSNYVHPSLEMKKPAAQQLPPAPSTVNERLAQLRRENVSQELTLRQKELATNTSKRSVPPALSGILGLPEVAPPAPKPGSRIPHRLRTGAAGPAPPRSWLTSSGSNRNRDPRYGTLAARKARRFGSDSCASRKRPVDLCDPVDGKTTISRRSLTHYTLRTIAQEWMSIDDDGLSYLAEYSADIRCELTRYVSYYGPEEGLSPHDLELLLYGNEAMHHLDLTGIIGWSISVKNLIRILSTKRRSSIDQATKLPPEEISESWEDDDELRAEQGRDTPRISKSLPASSAMTRLFLAAPPPTASWLDLLALTSHLPTLTHLSLSQWPYPTKTPNSATSFYMASNGAMIPSSSSTIYSDLDGDHAEASSLLRHLARNTYCLKWLDLSACTWVAALAPEPALYSRANASQRVGSAADDGSSTNTWSVQGLSGPEWNGAWSRLSTLRLAQEQPPEALPMISGAAFATMHPASAASSNASIVRRDLKTYFGNKDRQELYDKVSTPGETIKEKWEIWRAPANRGRKCNGCGLLVGSADTRAAWTCRVCDAWNSHVDGLVDAWIQAEVGLREVSRRIKKIRRASGGQHLEIDLGWMKL